MLREVRQWLTERVTNTAVDLAPRLRPGVLDAVEGILASGGPWLPILSKIVAENLRSAGLYDPRVHREYFAWSAAHLADTLQVFRFADQVRPDQPGVMPEGLAAITRDRVRLDATFSHLQEAFERGKGVVVMGVHAANFVLVLARLRLEIPITVYLRYSKDPRRRRVRERLCRTMGTDLIAEPASAMDPTRRGALLAEALQAGRVLVITPDLPQKRDDGVAVRFFDGEAYLPSGPPALALLTGASLLTLIARPAGRAICLEFHGPMKTEDQPRTRGWRTAAIQACLQWFTDVLVERFLRVHPQLWFLWGDRRWTRVFRGDPRYTRRLAADEPVASS